MKRFLLCIAAASALAGTARAQTFDDLRFHTENFPPFNFTDDSGRPTGIAVDLLAEVFRRIGSKKTAADIKLGPWSDGYDAALKGPNAVVFSMARNKEREKLFKWAGPTGASRAAVFSRKSRGLKLESPASLKKLKASAVKDDVGHLALVKAVGPDADVIMRPDFAACLKDVEEGWADVVVYDDMAALWMLKEAGLADKYEIVQIVGRPDLAYAMYAISRDVPDSVVEQFQNAIDEIKIDGEFLKITNKYTK